jgi:hypothetical protein
VLQAQNLRDVTATCAGTSTAVSAAPALAAVSAASSCSCPSTAVSAAPAPEAAAAAPAFVAPAPRVTSLLQLGPAAGQHS